MHIAFLTPEYPHEHFGASAGLGTSIQNLARSLVERGIKVSVFVYGVKEKQVFHESGINFIGIKQRKYRFFGWYLYRKHLQKVVNKTIIKEKIDLVEAPDWTGITAFMNLKCSLVIRMHGSDAYFCNLDGRKQKIKNRYFEKTALKNADHLISVSEFTAKKTDEIFELKRNIQVIPNSVSINKFLPSIERANSGQILYFGSLIRKKGVLELANIFNYVIKKYPKAELVLVGKDVIDFIEKRSTFDIFKSKLSKSAEKQISYLGEVSYDAVKYVIMKSQVVVLPSFAEALPMTWLEAMSMGKALVTSDIGWATEVMIDGYTGYTESPKKHQLYADKIVKLLIDPSLREEMGQRAREKVTKNFSSDVVARKNIMYYNFVLNKSRNR